MITIFSARTVQKCYNYFVHLVFCQAALWINNTHPFNGPFSGTTQVSRYQKGKTNLDFTGARDSEWQWHQLGHMQVCTSLQTDNHASTPPLSFLQAGCPSCRPANSVKALKAKALWINNTDKIKAWTQQPPITWRKTAYSISYTTLPWLTKATNALTTFLNKNWAETNQNGAQKYTRIRNFKTSNRCCWIGKLLLVLWYYNAEIQSEIWSGLRQNINNDINLTNCYSFRGTLSCWFPTGISSMDPLGRLCGVNANPKLNSANKNP